MENKGTILIVEDNELNSEMIKELLEEVGFQTLEARDADASIQLAKLEHPDLILMDIYMPGKNGYEASQSLKSDPDTHDIPIVAFTALAMDGDRKRAEAAGCIGIISKPVDIDTFALTVTSYLSTGHSDTEDLLPTITVFPSNLKEPDQNPDSDKEFLMQLSHDLQGPIRKVDQFSAWLKKSVEEKLSPDEQDYLKGIDRAAQQMKDVLSIALESQKINKNF